MAKGRGRTGRAGGKVPRSKTTKPLRQENVMEEADEKTQDSVEEFLTKSTTPTTLRGTERS